MSTAARNPSQDSAAAAAERRKRRERGTKNRAVDPKNIVSGAGQPLDPGVRRELEERLGHDLGRVRLHTDRDSAQLTDLLGADAVAVGQDIFFREGAFQPGTREGQRLLAHELLHTIQNPYGSGALHAGREPGAVSLPQQAIEREAEAGARELTAEGPSATAVPEVAGGQATPGWLRYTQVDADRNRLEQLDPATLVDRLANAVVRSLHGDPEDRSKRARLQLGRLSEELQDQVYERLENRLLSTELDRLIELVDGADAEEFHDADGPEQSPLGAPFVESDAAEELLRDRESERRDEEKEQEREERPAEAPAPEGKERPKEAAESAKPRPVEGRQPAPKPDQDQDRPPEGGREETEGPGGGNHAPNPGQEEGGRAPEGPGSEGPGTEPGSGESEQDGGDSASAGKDRQGGEQDGAEADAKSGGAAEGGKDAEGKDGDKEEDAGGGEQEEAPAASEEESAAKNRPGMAEALVASQQIPAEDEKKPEDEKPGNPALNGRPALDAEKRSTLEGQRAQDLVPEEAAPGPAQGGDSEVEVGGGEKSAWDTKLQPEDFLPEKDLDVSGVPTADKLDPATGGAEPAMPSFPAPPPTKADQVQAERDAEDAEEETGPEAEEESEGPALPGPSVETEGSPEAGLGLSAVDLASGPKPGSGLAGAPPRTGEDEKAGPAANRAAEQEAEGRKDAEAASEEAAKEGKGAGKDKDGARGEGESQKAGGSKSAEGRASSSEEKKEGAGAEGSVADAEKSGAEPGKGTKAAPEEKNGTTDDDKSPSAGRDSQVTGGSNADVPGRSSGSGNSDGAGSGASSGSSSGTSPGAASGSGGPAQTTKSSAKPDSAASGSAKSAPEPARRTAGPVSNANSSAPKAESRSPRAAGSAPKSAGKPAGRGAAPKRGGGGGGAKGAPAKAKKDSAAAPNLSQVAPEAGLGQAAKLKPHRAMEAMGGVSSSVDRTVGDEHKQLAAAPPSMTRPAGSPQTLKGEPRTDAPARYNQDAVQKSEAPKADEAKVEGARLPDENFDPGATSDGEDLDDVSTEDPSLAGARTGTAPGVEMQGAAKETTKAQNEAVDAKTRETLATGRQDAARGMGEDQIFPDVPKSVMKSKVPGPRGGGGGKGARTSVNTGAVPVEAASEVAEHEKGPELQQAFAKGQKDMGAAKEKKDGDFRDTQTKHKQQVDKEIAANSDQQSGERRKAMADVAGQREQWRAEQDAEVKKLGDKKGEKHEAARKEVKEKEEETDKKAAKEKEDSDRKIAEENRKAKEEAEKKKREEKKKKDDAPAWKKVLDFIVDLFNDLVDAIVDLVKKAFDAVTGFIKDFAEKVGGWINEARKWIADKVKGFVDAVVDFVKSAVQAVVDLAKKIGEAIVNVVKAAIEFVQKLATALMEAVGDLLDALGKALSAALDFLGKALSAVVDAVVSGIKAVIDFAKNLLLALGEWMLIAADFLSDPGGWLSGAKNSAEDGAKNHLFNEVSSAVKQWFKEKIQEIIGVPKAVIDKLIKGGMSLDDMVKEAWEAVVPQLPLIIGELVMTKVVAKLIPGAGWALAVIDAIRTAWGALSAILSSLQAVLAWLKAVRQGGAGLLFAKAVAAGVVALLEVLYQALLSGIGKYVSKVGSRLKGVAAKMGKDKDGKPGDEKSGQGDDPKDPGKDKDKDKPGQGKDGKGDEKKQDDDTPVNLKKPGGTGTPGKGKGPGGKDDKGKTGTPGKGKDGDKDDDKKDTSPTPAPKPKPKPDPPAKPKPDTETTKPKPDKDSNKDNSKDSSKKDDSKQDDKKNDKDSSTDPKKDKDKKDQTKDGKGDGKKDNDKDKPGKDKSKDDKPKDKKDGDKDKKKDKHKKDKDSKGKKDKHDKDKKGRRDKGKRRLKDRQNKRDKRRKEEKDTKNDRLQEIIARIRPILKSRLEPGMSRSVHRQLLAALRHQYKLTKLYKRDSPDFTVRAALNPEDDVITGITEESRDYLEKHHLPRPVIMPNPRMNVPPGSEMNAKYINPKFAHDNGEKPGGQYTQGWEYIDDTDLNAAGKPQWDRMHLIPRELGGPANTGNFVPALNDINRPFYSSFEKKAALIFGSADETKGPPAPEEKMPIIGWYTVNLTRWEGKTKRNYPGSAGPRDPYPVNHYPPGFPKTFTASWGLYGRKSGRTGKNHSDWTKLGTSQSRTLHINPPPVPGATHQVDINTSSDVEVKRALNSTPKFHEAVLEIRERERNAGKPKAFSSFSDMKNKLKNWKSPGGHAIHGLATELENVKERYDAGRFTF